MSSTVQAHAGSAPADCAPTSSGRRVTRSLPSAARASSTSLARVTPSSPRATPASRRARPASATAMSAPSSSAAASAASAEGSEDGWASPPADADADATGAAPAGEAPSRTATSLPAAAATWPLSSSRTAEAMAGEVACGLESVARTPAGVRMRLPRQAASRRQATAWGAAPTRESRKSETSRGGHQPMSGSSSLAASGQACSSSTRWATASANRMRPAATRVLAAGIESCARTARPRACSLGASVRQAAATSGATTTTRKAPLPASPSTCRQINSSTASGPAGSSSRTAPPGSSGLASSGRNSVSTRYWSSGARPAAALTPPATTAASGASAGTSSTAIPRAWAAAASSAWARAASSPAGPTPSATKSARSDPSATARANSLVARGIWPNPAITKAASSAPCPRMRPGRLASASHGSTRPRSRSSSP